MSLNNRKLTKLQQKIASKASCMNSTKWKALFAIIRDINPQCIAKIKLLLDTKIREVAIPDKESFINEKYLEEYWGVFELKEIEWIIIPSEIVSERKNREEVLTPKVKKQHIEKIEKALQTGKQFEYELSKSGLKIYGYK